MFYCLKNKFSDMNNSHKSRNSFFAGKFPIITLRSSGLHHSSVTTSAQCVYKIEADRCTNTFKNQQTKTPSSVICSVSLINRVRTISVSYQRQCCRLAPRHTSYSFHHLTAQPSNSLELVMSLFCKYQNSMYDYPFQNKQSL